MQQHGGEDLYTLPDFSSTEKSTEKRMALTDEFQALNKAFSGSLFKKNAFFFIFIFSFQFFFFNQPILIS